MYGNNNGSISEFGGGGGGMDMGGMQQQRRNSMSAIGAVQMSKRDQDALVSMIQSRREAGRRALVLWGLGLVALTCVILMLTMLSQMATMREEMDLLKRTQAAMGGGLSGPPTPGTLPTPTPSSTSITQLEIQVNALEAQVNVLDSSLSSYATTSAMDAALAAYATTAAMNTALAGKSDTGHTHSQYGSAATQSTIWSQLVSMCKAEANANCCTATAVNACDTNIGSKCGYR